MSGLCVGLGKRPGDAAFGSLATTLPIVPTTVYAEDELNQTGVA